MAPSSSCRGPWKGCADADCHVQTALVPLLISLALFVALTYVVLPLYRRHRARYAQYLPLQHISHRTSSLRERFFEQLRTLLLPSSRRHSDGGRRDSSEHSLFDDDEDGEGMVGLAVDAGRRRELERGAEGSDGQDDRRLSRELEEVFRDDSDDEHERDTARVSTRN